MTVIEIPIDVETHPRGENSVEKVTQEQREQTALGAVYSNALIPDSPTEPAYVMPDDEVDKEVKRMTSGPEVDAIFWSSEPMPAPHFASATVAELVNQLTKGSSDSSLNGMTSFSGQGLDFQAVGLNANPSLSAVQALPQEQLQVLLQQLRAEPSQSQPQGASYGNADQAWTATPHQFSTDYGQGFNQDDADQERWGDEKGRGRGHGRGGRGRGDDGYRQNNKRKPCSFFAAGRRASNLFFFHPFHPIHLNLALGHPFAYPLSHQRPSFLIDSENEQARTDDTSETNRCKYGDQCDFAHEILS